MDLQEAFDQGFASVKSYVDGSFLEFEKRIAVLEARSLERGDKGDPGEPGADGKDADAGAIAAAVLEKVMEAVNAIPPAKDGTDGKDADPELIRSMLQEAVAALPPAEKGAQGEKGEAGNDADSETITSTVLEKVMAEVKAIPIPKDGKDGLDGKDGKDGVGLASAMIDREGNLAVTMTDGSVKSLGLVIGKDGEPGRDGKDGADALGFDDLSIEYDGERGITLKFERGEQKKEFPLTLPIIIDRGVWREGEHKRGDAVSFGGSLWIAQEETSDKPETSKAWRLAVKRGRDGKDGVMKSVPELKPVKVG